MKLYQIKDDDLATLERDIPELSASDGKECLAQSTRIRRVQSILSNVRWNYQPHTNIEEVE